MNVYDIITKKRNGNKLTSDEISFMVNGFTRGLIPEYQMSAFLMAIWFQKLDDEERSQLTSAMIETGKRLDFSSLDMGLGSGSAYRVKVDKHSTGGVGDGTSLAIAPIVAAAGGLVPMMSGRGLGHTGGTLDKLESIPGFQTHLTEAKIKAILNDVGVVMMGQTDDIVPADKKMYQLRDVTATVDSIDLISASIMSKKLAEGMDALVLDIKTGNGAFMQKPENAINLAKAMIKIGTGFGKEINAYITDMNQPLGNCVGNSLEMLQTIELLKGEEKLNIDYKDMAVINGSTDFFKSNAIGIDNEGPVDFLKLTLVLSAKMLLMGKIVKTFEQGIAIATKMIDSGKALEKLEQMIIAQNGNPRVINDYSLFKQTAIKEDYILNKTGYISKLNTYKIGMAALILGAGRENINSTIDHSVGFIFHKKLNDFVEKNQPVLCIYANDKLKLEMAKNELNEAFELSDKPIDQQPLIYGSVNLKGYEELKIPR